MSHQKLLEKARRDPEFRRRLLADPRTVLAELGFTLPAGVQLKVVENTADTWYLVLPPEGELSEDELRSVAGGNFNCLPPEINSLRYYMGAGDLMPPS